MTLYLKTADGYVAWLGEPIDGVRHPLSIETTWSEQELEAVGLFVPTPADPVPDGKVSTGLTVEDVGGRPAYVHQLQDRALEPLTARQLRLGLLAIGIKPADVAAAIAALPEEQRDAAGIEWDYASEYRRDHTLIATLGASFGLSTEQIDAAWRDAMAL